jgi:hypothetical protein
MIFIFLNVGRGRKGEAGTIEDENQEHRNNNKDILKGKSRTIGDVKLKIEEMNYEKIWADVRRHESKMR